MKTRDMPKPNLKLYDAIRASGLSGEEVARRAGLTPTTVSKVLNGHVIPHSSTAFKIAKVLRRDALDIFTTYGRKAGPFRAASGESRTKMEKNTCKNHRGPPG